MLRMNRVLQAFLSVLLLTLVLSAGCNRKSTPPQNTNVSFSTAGGAAGGVHWSVPKRWSELGPRPMRAATYGIPPVEGDPESAECAVFFFGTGQGGTVDQNVERWVGQFENPSSPSRSSEEVNGLKVTTVKVGGTYVGMAGMGGQAEEKKENFQLLGVIVEAPQGLVFFKCTGPSKTISGLEGEFDAMINSLSQQ